MDRVAAVAEAHAARVRIAAQKRAGRRAVTQLDPADRPVVRVQLVLGMAQTPEDVFGRFLPDRDDGIESMSAVPDAAEAGAAVLSDHAGHPPPPQILNAVADRQVGVIGGVPRLIAMAPHDVAAEVGRRHRVIHPYLEPAVVAIELLQRARRVRPRVGEVAIGMQAVDVSAPDQDADPLPLRLAGVPVRELVLHHVEVDRIPDFEPDPLPHGGRPGAVQEFHRLEIGRGVGRLVEIAADRHHRPPRPGNAPHLDRGRCGSHAA